MKRSALIKYVNYICLVICVCVVVIFSWRCFFNRKELLVIDGLPFVKAKINNNESYLLLDLGSRFTRIEKESLDRWKLHAEGSEERTTSIAGREFFSKFYKLPCIEARGQKATHFAVLENVPSSFGTLWGEFNSHGVTSLGKLGRDFFLGKTLYLNPSKGIFEVGLSKTIKDAICVKFTLEPNLGIVLELKSDISAERSMRFLFDTGCNISLIKKGGLEHDEKPMTLYLPDSRAFCLVDFYETDLSQIPEVDGILGFDIIEKCETIINFSQNTIMLNRPAS